MAQFTKRTIATAACAVILAGAGTAYADVDIAIDPVTKDIVEASAAIITTYADAGPGLTPDTAVAALVSQAETAVAPLTERVVATAQSDILRAQNDAGESALGNLIADSQRATMGTDFAFMNPGGIRADIYAGQVTWGNLYTVQPFNNYLVKMELTGQQVYDVLNQQWFNQSYAKILQISGLTYTWDNSRPENDRVVEVRKDGVAIDLNAVYSVTANNFISDGGDNFIAFKQGIDKVVGPVDVDALTAYMQNLAQPVSAQIEGRITRLN